MKLYPVTTIREEQMTDVNGNPYSHGTGRCVAMCETMERATSIVENNIFDIYEMGYYPYAVIEEITTDEMYGGFSTFIQWYAWQGDIDTGKYVPIEVPEKYINVIGWWG